jgi:hypothetical protein
MVLEAHELEQDLSLQDRRSQFKADLERTKKLLASQKILGERRQTRRTEIVRGRVRRTRIVHAVSRELGIDLVAVRAKLPSTMQRVDTNLWGKRVRHSTAPICSACAAAWAAVASATKAASKAEEAVAASKKTAQLLEKRNQFKLEVDLVRDQLAILQANGGGSFLDLEDNEDGDFRGCGIGMDFAYLGCGKDINAKTPAPHSSLMRLQKAARKWASAKNTDKSEDVLVSTISEEERVMMNDVDVPCKPRLHQCAPAQWKMSNMLLSGCFDVSSVLDETPSSP